MSVQVVWFKRDLRITDHPPLLEASRRGALVPLYVFERKAETDLARRRSPCSIRFCRAAAPITDVPCRARPARLRPARACRPIWRWACCQFVRVMHALIKARMGVDELSREQRPVKPLTSLRTFESRLHWHCHFIQKLESQPEMEFSNLHRAYVGMRAQSGESSHFEAWARGETGFPMIDACMRMLLATGWINFRMRAMLVSFSSYQLWQHWREPALHLARQFLDYEPGIHYPQVQMQSGTKGINTIRMYNPVKQARDHDPAGQFVRRWIPALAQLPDAHIVEPSNTPMSVQQRDVKQRANVVSSEQSKQRELF